MHSAPIRRAADVIFLLTSGDAAGIGGLNADETGHNKNQRASLGNLLNLNFRKPLIDPFAPQKKPKLDCSFLDNESVMRQDGVYDFERIATSDFYNWSELIMTFCVEDNRNENEVPSIFEIGHE